MIQIKHMSCIKNQTVILNNINLHIKAGEKVAIIGPSGAGKTTLFNILSRHETDYEGHVTLNEKALTSYNSSKAFAKEVGIISQGIHLIDNLKVIYNVAIGQFASWSFLKSLKLFFVNDQKSLNALESVHMNNHSHKKTAHLSGGEKQRVAIARLLVQEPNIILADEPIAALDPKLSKDIIELLFKHTKKQTLLMILHQTEFATKYFDRVIALKQGKIHFDLPSHEVSQEMLEVLYG